MNLAIVLSLVFSYNLFAAEEAHFCKATGSFKDLFITVINMPPSLGSWLTT
jgi:hypothetical protein